MTCSVLTYTPRLLRLHSQFLTFVLSPDWGVVRGLLNTAKLVVNASINKRAMKRLCCQDQINTKTSVVIKPLRAIIKPRKPFVCFRV